MILRWLLFLVLPAAPAMAANQPAVLVEAESFDYPGGWVIDQQFMDQMGSPFLLAHGIGVPVADARTTVRVPKGGVYRVWVRTRDWVAGWKAPGSPGRFQVTVNGVPLKTLFGTEGALWHWQDGGAVRLTGDQVSLGLHDLTGFDGRCDAILLSGDSRFQPPDGGDELSALRRRALALPDVAPDAGDFDISSVAAIVRAVEGLIAGPSAA